jgi:hypothetical protein
LTKPGPDSGTLADRMTTYVLGAGASFHAGYPLCSQLWARMVMWVVETQPPGSELRQAIDVVATLNGPVGDVESVFTDLDLGRGPFGALTEDQRKRTRRGIRLCLRGLLKSICEAHGPAPLYEDFANRVEKGDIVVTFNYDVSLESELIRAGHKFRVRNGYGSSFRANWDEPESDVIVLKPHGSINWIGRLFEGVRAGYFGVLHSSLGPRPFVDNRDSVLPGYPSSVLDREFENGGETDPSVTLVLPTYEKRFSVTTSVDDEWTGFYESLWSQAAESLQRSDSIVIVGYSMPAADRRSRALLLWSANKRADVTICCASSSATMKAQFESHGFWRVRDAGTFEDLFGSSVQ